MLPLILTINSYYSSNRIIVLASITDMERVPCEVRPENLSEISIRALPVAARSKALFCSSRLLGLRVRIPQGHGCLSLVFVVSSQVEVCVTDRSFVQRNPPECMYEISCNNNPVHLQRLGRRRPD